MQTGRTILSSILAIALTACGGGSGSSSTSGGGGTGGTGGAGGSTGAGCDYASRAQWVRDRMNEN
ncbi:MAG: peptidase S41, partial [Oxalobacteraceae bacterium]